MQTSVVKLAIESVTRAFAGRRQWLGFARPTTIRSAKVTVWNDFEYFDPQWMKRIEKMATYIPHGWSVIDLGCGEMWLKEHLSPASCYYPVDYKKRSDDVIVCDFNKHQFPDIRADVSFVSGCLEYVVDYEWMVNEISLHTHRCLLSYCATDDFPDIPNRRSLAWMNDLSRSELVSAFFRSGMRLSAEERTNQGDRIYVFDAQHGPKV